MNTFSEGIQPSDNHNSFTSKKSAWIFDSLTDEELDTIHQDYSARNTLIELEERVPSCGHHDLDALIVCLEEEEMESEQENDEYNSIYLNREKLSACVQDVSSR